MWAELAALGMPHILALVVNVDHSMNQVSHFGATYHCVCTTSWLVLVVLPGAHSGSLTLLPNCLVLSISHSLYFLLLFQNALLSIALSILWVVIRVPRLGSRLL